MSTTPTPAAAIQAAQIAAIQALAPALPQFTQMHYSGRVVVLMLAEPGATGNPYAQPVPTTDIISAMGYLNAYQRTAHERIIANPTPEQIAAQVADELEMKPAC